MKLLYDIGINIIGGVIAAFLAFVLSRVFNSKNDILYSIEIALKYAIQIENFKNFPTDYELVMHSLECLHKHIFEIHKNIYPFTMFSDKKKKQFIETLLYNISLRCEYSMFTAVGYRDEKEKEARLEKMKKHFYIVESDKQNCSILSLSLSLIKQLFDGNNIESAFTEEKISPYSFVNIIDVNAFKFKNGQKKVNNFIQDKGLTKDEYNKIVQSIQKSAKSDGVRI